MHAIQHKYSTNKRYEYGDPVPLNAEVLRQILGQTKYRLALNEALDSGLILTNNSYVVGQHSRRYSLAPAFLHEPVTYFNLTDKFLVKRLKKYRELRKQKAAASRTLPIHELLFSDLKNIELDELTNEDLWFYAAYEPERYNPLKMAYDNFQEKQIYGLVCKNGRFHSNITNLQTEVRNHLSFSLTKERITWYDVGCCQPLLLSLIAEKCYKDTNITDTLYNTQQINHHQHHTQHTPPYSGIFLNELKLFRQECEDRQFYQLAATRLNRPLEKVKTQILQVFFDRQRTKCKYTEYFKQYYPFLYLILSEYKKDDHRFLANYLQQTESDIMLNRICGRIKEMNPEVPLFTIHDCIGTIPTYADFVFNNIRAEFSKLKLTPTIRRE